MGVVTYKCPGCGATLSFDPKSQNVACKNCGQEYTLEEIKKYNKVESSNTETFNFKDFDFEVDLNKRLTNTKVYKCESCGAEIEADDKTVATICPYCDNNVVLTDRVSNGLRPNAVIPFKIKKEDLPDLILDFYKNKRFLPKNFITRREMEKAQGVYVPFWLFSGYVSGDAEFSGYRETKHREGDYEVTETHHYSLERSGNMKFEKVPTDASTIMDNDLMDSVEPYDYSSLVDYEDAYLTGYVCDRFDSTPDNEFPRANRRMINSTISALQGTTFGYSGVSLQNDNLRSSRISCKYVFLPVYILNCNFEGKKYRYAINGQTGKVVGELPISKSKKFFFFLSRFLIISLIAAIVGGLIYYFMG